MKRTCENLARKLPQTYKLSDHFTASEMACHHCGRVYVTPALMIMLEKLRDLFGIPLSVCSGYRCPSHNVAIGGAPSSKHMLGMAVDIAVPEKYKRNPEEFLEAAQIVAKEVHGGYHYYPKSHFIHIDCWVWPPDRRW
jgi:uncharacterized protein YcbK (DUF882 family)